MGCISLTVGCSSPRVPVGPQPPPAAALGEVVEHTSCGLLVFDLIPAAVNGRTERAYKHALENRGSMLADVELKYSWYYVPLLGDLVCTTVRGRVVQ